MTTTPQQPVPQQPAAPPVPEFVPVAKVGDVRPGEGKLVRPAAGRYRGKAMAVFNENGRHYILNYICPHSGGPIGEGTIKDGIVTCPFHGWSYQADTGLPQASAEHSISAYEVKVEGDAILVGGVKHPASGR